MKSWVMWSPKMCIKCEKMQRVGSNLENASYLLTRKVGDRKERRRSMRTRLWKEKKETKKEGIKKPSKGRKVVSAQGYHHLRSRVTWGRLGSMR